MTLQAGETENPYVGPRPFERYQREVFFGRRREVRDFASLVISDRVALLYAASGAGKTSLLNAGILPRLEERDAFEVLPPARVRFGAAKPPPGVQNVFVASVLLNWVDDLEVGRELTGFMSTADRSTRQREPPPRPSGRSSTDRRPEAMSLAEFLEEREHPRDEHGFPGPRLIVFDQAEELFTAYPEHWSQREDFFEHVAAAVTADPLLHVVFAIREDFLAQLEPYERLVPGGLAARFRLERLGADAALRAVIGPLEKTRRRFAEGVAEKLVGDLLTFRIDTGAGESVPVRGEFVEPVQLQVVCQDLWSSLPEDVEEIGFTQLEHYGAVDTALSRFYGKAIAAAAKKASVDEGELRTAFEELFITPVGTRGTVYRGAASTGGIPNEAIDELEARHLVRAEWNRGARWYELTHDRMIEPIRDSNARAGRAAADGASEVELARQASLALARAEELRASGAHDEALDSARLSRNLYEQAESAPGIADSVLKEGEILGDLARYDEARAAVERALAYYDEVGDSAARGRALFDLGTIDEQQGDVESALRMFSEVEAIFLTLGNRVVAAEAVARQAQLHAVRLEAEPAVSRSNDAIALASDSGNPAALADAFFRQSVVAFTLNDSDLADRATREAVVLYSEVGNRPAMAVVKANLAYLLLQSDRSEDGLRAAEESVALFREIGDNEGAANALRLVGEHLSAIERYGEAAECFGQALELVPDDVATRYSRGVALVWAGDLERAEVDLQVVVDAEPDWAPAWNARGQALARLGRPEEAIVALDRALQLDSSYPELVGYVQCAHAVALAQLGKTEEALAEFEESLDRAPRNAWAWYERAVVYERLGNTDEAVAGFRASLEHDDPSLAPWMRERVERRLAASAEAEERFAPAALRYLPGRRKRR